VSGVTVAFEVVDDPARVCAAMMVSAATGGGEIVLTGGSTPKVAYGEFVHAVQTVGLDVSRTTFWIGDERCVGPEDDRSNFKMIKESLLDPLATLTPPTVHRIKGELGPERAAEEYERELRDAGAPQFDLVLLGIGPDAHIASLFPGQASLQERSRLVVGVPEAEFEPFVSRVSLTLPALTSGRQVVILATGAAKADAIAKGFGPDSRPDPRVPASLLAPAAKEITVLLDPAAASRLTSPEPS
jgi:6-phosphogluconolactonase